MRVYCEDQLMDNIDAGAGAQFYAPSALKDAAKCQTDLRKGTQAPSTYRENSFKKLTNFLVGNLNKDDYTFQGPFVKPLQSLFNKVYIRRGQTSVDIVGDMTRATLLVKNKSDLSAVMLKIQESFPEIHGEMFEGPERIGVNSSLHRVFKMKKIPDTNIIPYRLKENGSQRKRIENKQHALLFNLNFFDGVPEYHRVGCTEMFVAFELQIGLEAEINGLREDHLAYEERRILEAQPLLKRYKESKEKINKVNASTTPVPSNMIEKAEDYNDFRLITAVLGGNFSNCKYRELDQKEIRGEGTAPMPPERLCLNNKRLNIWANQNKAVILDGPFELDPSRRYSVDLMSCKLVNRIGSISIGLFAFFGPYMVQISALLLAIRHAKEVFLIKPGVNFLTMERISMLPPKSDGIVLVAWGGDGNNQTWKHLKESYRGMKLILNQYEE